MEDRIGRQSKKIKTESWRAKERKLVLECRTGDVAQQ